MRSQNGVWGLLVGFSNRGNRKKKGKKEETEKETVSTPLRLVI